MQTATAHMDWAKGRKSSQGGSLRLQHHSLPAAQHSQEMQLCRRTQGTNPWCSQAETQRGVQPRQRKHTALR